MLAVAPFVQATPNHTGADRPAPSAHHAHGAGPLTFALVAMGSLALAAAVVAFVSLDRATERHGAVVQRIGDLRAETLRLDALEWRMAAERGASAALQAAIVESRAQFRFALEELHALAPADSATERLTNVFTSYASAVDAEIEALQSGDTEGAREIDDSRVDPAFESLVSLVGEIATAQHARARGEHGSARRASAVALVLALGAFWLLA